MSAAKSTHRTLLLAAQRSWSEAQLGWSRSAQLDPAIRERMQELQSPQGMERLDEALRLGLYDAVERPFVARQLACFAAEDALLAARPLNAQLLAAPMLLEHTAQQPHELLAALLGGKGDVTQQAAREQALCAALDPMALHWVECRKRADEVFTQQLTTLTALVQPQPAAPEPSRPALRDTSAQPSATQADPVRGTPEHAAHWLSASDDAAREMVRWLVRSNGHVGDWAWPAWFSALRAPQFDGLARPSGRLRRLADGVRRLGFERELSTCMRAERSWSLLIPQARVLALHVPEDIRVIEAGIEYGVLSDLVAAQAIGEALALALVSPAQSDVLRTPCASGVSSAVGALLLQLRAQPSFLARIEGWNPDVSERLARHAAIFVLLMTRLHAALWLAEQQPARSDRERLEHMSRAVERALVCPLPPGLVALMFFASALQGADFLAADAGLALHAALRERYDEDWYANPRSAEVLRGACMRGNLLTTGAFCAELDAPVSLGVARALELLA
jgi:hypothetical protein